MSTRKTEPLTPQQEQAVEDILQDTRDHYRKSGFISDEDWKLYREDLASPNCPFA